MAGVLQAGDFIKIAELAYTVYDYGFSKELNASKTYREFFEDVRKLKDQLDLVVKVINKAKRTIADRRGNWEETLVFDGESFFGIVGDVEDTLRECLTLLEKNKRYHDPTGFTRNVEFNAFVASSFQRLRGRILLHTIRLDHAVKPIEVDLLEHIHSELRQLRRDVHDMHDDLRAFMGALVPSLAGARQAERDRTVLRVDMPEEAERLLTRRYNDYLGKERDARDEPSLQLLAGLFLEYYDRSTVGFRPGRYAEETKPSPLQYMSLLRCQLLIEKMRQHPQATESGRYSHWPRFISGLEDDLSDECRRFNRYMSPPDISIQEYTDDLTRIWTEPQESETSAMEEDTVIQQVMFEDLLEVPLVSSSRHIRRSIRLLRRAGTNDRQYRVVFVNTDEKDKITERPIDFDILSANICPLYALPTGGRHQALELLLQEQNRKHRLEFTQLADLLKFQRALTGYMVVDNYLDHNVVASLVGRTNEYANASIQVWYPKRLDGNMVVDTPNSQFTPQARGHRAISSVSNDSGYEPSSSHHNLGNLCRSPSRVSSASNMTSNSRSSSAQEHAVKMSVNGKEAPTSIFNKPLNPLIVLFAQRTDNGLPFTIALPVDEDTEPNMARCDCRIESKNCQFTAIEQNKGKQKLRVERWGGYQQFRWNILDPAVARGPSRNQMAGVEDDGDDGPQELSLSRLSLKFEDTNRRQDVGGKFCQCKPKKETEEVECMRKGHSGYLGMVRVRFRQQMKDYMEAQHGVRAELQYGRQVAEE